MDIALQNIPNGNPVLAGALHTDIPAVVLKQPLLERLQIPAEGGKALLAVPGHKSICLDDGGNEKGLVHIDATADGIRQFHLVPSFLNGRQGLSCRAFRRLLKQFLVCGLFRPLICACQAALTLIAIQSSKIVYNSSCRAL